MSTRTEHEIAARELRAQGLKVQEIADRMGVARSTAGTWLADPGGLKLRARKDGYRGLCRECGAQTDGSNGRAKAPDICVRCYVAPQLWTAENIIEAIQAWARETGGIPPSATDWNPRQAINAGHPEKAEKFYADDAWPHVSTVQERFGSWSAGIAASGLVPRRPGMYGRDGEDMSLCLGIRERYEAGESLGMLAEAYDCWAISIAYRIRKAGGKSRSHSEAQRVRWERNRVAA